METFQPPNTCPFCGWGLNVVRHVMANVYEIACEHCARLAIVMVDDHAALPTPKATREGGETKG